MSDKPTYLEDNYATRFLQGYAVFPDDQRMFHRPGYLYDIAAAVTAVEMIGRRLTLSIDLVSGEKLVLMVQCVAPGVLRLQIGEPEAQFADLGPMIAADLTVPLPLQFIQNEAQVECQFNGYRLVLCKRPFCIRVYSPTGDLIFESETEKIVDMYTAPPLGLRKMEDQAWAFLSWRNRNLDRYFGLGEKFTRFERTSSRATIWAADTCGSNTCDMSYKSVPALFSTAGWALMLHSSFRSYWEIGSFSYATSSFMVEEPKLDLFLILAPSLKEQVQVYTWLTGRPSMPPKWAFGLWMSRAAYTNREQMMEVADRLRTEAIPCDVFNIDPTWMNRGYYNEIGVEVCHFDWNEKDWGSPEQLFLDFSHKGFGICLWINPYLAEGSLVYQEALERGYLVRTVNGGVARLEFNLAAGIVDFSNPQAKYWWQIKLMNLLRQGAAVFKVDFGDRVPEEALFHNGKTGLEMHNLYVHLYAETVYETVVAVQKTGIIWRRPGYIGTQRFPGCWAGDTQVTWEGMKGALRGGLSAAFCGESFWSHDIGGFVGPKPGPELYIRWMQLGMLSPFTRFHGTTPREPWHYPKPATEVARYYANLRYRLIPYLLAFGYESAQTGLPLLRPMVLEFEGEPYIDQVDDQYMLGESLLVAPVWAEGMRQRTIYFPVGRWWSLYDPQAVVEGPGFIEVDAPLERMPVFVRGGRLIPAYREAPQHLKGGAPREWQFDIYPGVYDQELTIPEDGFTLQLTCQQKYSQTRLQVNPAPITVTIRLIGQSAEQIVEANPNLPFKIVDGIACWTVEGKNGFDISYTT
jgi:alpha-D-xyloside xylohydrolase